MGFYSDEHGTELEDKVVVIVDVYDNEDSDTIISYDLDGDQHVVVRES